MKISVENENYKYISDNTQEVDDDTAFFLCHQNKKYYNKDFRYIITPSEFKKKYNLDDIKIVGITGTNGKTTTAGAIYSFLIDLGYSVAMQGTRGFFVNDEKIEGKTLTTPLIFNTLNHLKIAKERGCEFFIMEVSSHAIEQKRIESLDFELKVYTNLTQDHLDYHKTFEEYKRVKESFFQDDSKKLINKDAYKIKFNIKNAYTYALDLPATFNIPAYTLKNGISGAVRYFNELETFHSNLYGLFNVYNLLASIASVKLLTQKPLKQICEVVENFSGVSGRMEVVLERPLVIVDFAHTPDGMEKVLDSLKDKKISLVFGAGGDRDKSKRPLMGRVANHFAKKIYLTSDNPRSEEPMDIINDIYEGIVKKDKVKIIEDRKEAIKVALNELEEDEILLILGKGDEEYQEIKGKKIKFSDKEVVQEVVEML